MRIVTWNCCGTLAANLPHLMGMAPDVAVVCEVPEFSTWSPAPGAPTMTGLSRRVWDRSPKELAVIALAPWSVRAHPAAASAPPWVLPAVVREPAPFTVVACWPVAMSGAPGYVGQVDAAVSWIESEAAGDRVVLAGDLNAPIPSTQKAYDRVQRRARDLGLVDAYRSAHGLDDDARPIEATYYHHGRVDRPFHIDHVLVPEDWGPRCSVAVGAHATWVGSGRSDHVPVVVDIALELELTSAGGT